MDLGSLLGDLESVLGDLDSILGRSWRLLARSWAFLGVQESPGQGASVARGKLSYPPFEIHNLDPHPYAHFQLEKGDGTTGKREKYPRRTKDHNRKEGRV